MRAALLLGTLALSASCAGAAPPSPSFRLDCAASDTDTAAQVYCVRTDTRSGDVKRVNIYELPVSNGPTASAAGRPGLYQTVCAATSTPQRSDFFCVRLNVDTGDLLLVNLTKVGQLP